MSAASAGCPSKCVGPWTTANHVRGTLIRSVPCLPAKLMRPFWLASARLVDQSACPRVMRPDLAMYTDETLPAVAVGVAPLICTAVPTSDSEVSPAGETHQHDAYAGAGGQ